MLTQEQKDQLEPLTKHEKFGKLLIEAIKTWETIKPSRRIWGLLKNKNVWELSSNNCCCLIGAALIGKESKVDNYISSTSDNYELSFDVIEDLVSGFDKSIYDTGSEACNFGKAVSDIVIGV